VSSIRIFLVDEGVIDPTEISSGSPIRYEACGRPLLLPTVGAARRDGQ
jgi:hypothetical protein